MAGLIDEKAPAAWTLHRGSARSGGRCESGNCATGVGQGVTLVPPELLDLFEA